MTLGGCLLRMGVALAVAGLVACSSDDDGGDRSGIIDLSQQALLLTVRLPADQAWQAAGVLPSFAAGDFNADGTPDLAVGDPLADPDDSRPDAGVSYVFFGPLSGDVDLSAADVRIFGASASDHLGGGLAAGDLNGDGIDDLIVGAPESDGLDDFRTDRGEAYIIFGRSDLPSLVDTGLVEQDATLRPAEGFSQLGVSFAVGDVNGDSVDDLVAGAPFAGREPNTRPGGPRTTVGEVYVVYGSPDLGGMIAVAREDQDAMLSGVRTFDRFGDSVSVADLNGDGIADIIVGSSGHRGAEGDVDVGGAAFVFYGSEDIADRLTLDDADLRVDGPVASSLGTLVFGFQSDEPVLIAAAPTGAGISLGPAAVGSAYVIRLPAAATSIDLASCDCATIVGGPIADAFFPDSLAVTEDRNSLAFGCRRCDEEGQTGAVYVVSVPSGSDVDLALEESKAIRVIGRPGDTLGGAVAFADLDGDGRPELLALADAGGTEPGAAAIYAITLGN